MKIRQYFLLLIFMLSYVPILAQVDTAWVRRYNGPGNGSDDALALAVDKAGNVYVTGLSEGDYATIKYAPNGDTLWVRRYDRSEFFSLEIIAFAVDDSGNVHVAGYSGGDYATIKYSPNGDTLWVRRYNGPGNSGDVASALAADNAGNVYVTGFSVGTGTVDYATIKYSPNGDTLWVRRYDGPGNSDDEPRALAVDGKGNLYVTGLSKGIGTGYDYATIKYAPNGDTLWVRRYNGPGNDYDFASALALDDSGNVYVTGSSDYNFFSGTGDYATIKYFSNGDTAWVRRYEGPAGLVDYAYSIAVDSSGNVYVTGESYGVGTSQDFATIKYYLNGDTAWVRRYDGPVNFDDRDVASALALDNKGNVYVTGYSGNIEGAGTALDYTTIKYSSSGDTLWVKAYNGPGNGFDEAYALAVDDSGNVYVIGWSEGTGTGSDYATIKYVQYTCLAKPGDVTGDGQVLLPDIVAIINFLFRSGPAPTPLCRGDANGNGNILLPDIVYLINFIFKSGPAPVKSQQCCL